MTQHKFKINHYNFSGTELDDLVHTEAPHFHFQIGLQCADRHGQSLCLLSGLYALNDYPGQLSDRYLTLE